MISADADAVHRLEPHRVTADGNRFLFCAALTSVQQERLRAVLNWPERLRVSR